MYYSDELNAYVFNSVNEVNKILDSNIYTMNSYVYDKIKHCLENDLISFNLFYIQIDNVLHNVKLKKENILSPLKKCLTRFEEQEDYEKCIECRDLIKSLE